MTDPTADPTPCGFCRHPIADHYDRPTRAVINERRRCGRRFCHCCGS